MTTIDQKKHDYRQALWKCRRGMLELDLMLNRFVTENYNGLSADKQAQLLLLLDEQDPQLYDWLFNGSSSVDSPFCALIEQIRQDKGTID